MSRKNVSLGGLVVALLLGVGQARGQGGMGGDTSGGYRPPQPQLPETSSPQGQPAHLTLSSWMLYPRGDGCCGPLCGGPIGGEVFLQSGVSFPVGGGVFGDVLRPGWDIEGGVRSLFFDTGCEAATAVTLSLSNINNNATDPRTVPYRINNLAATVNGVTPKVTIPVTVAGLNRTYVNLSIGREWWLWGPADADCTNFRVGVDGGGRYGTERLELQELPHVKDVIGGLFAAVHADFEWTCGGCVWQAGVRGEYSYTWSDILKTGNNTDTQELNLLFRAGVRY
jgi:hypothetical protein